MVEYQLPKLGVAGSNPVARSSLLALALLLAGCSSPQSPPPQEGHALAEEVAFLREKPGLPPAVPYEGLAFRVHRVAKGETLYGIARQYGVRVEAIMEANGIKDPKDLKAGQAIRIP